MSKVYSFRCVQNIPAVVQQVWDYFSVPDNLVHITPPGMGFIIKSEKHGKQTYAGEIMEYTLKPVAGISLYWMTEITHYDHLKYFVDEQRYGPYRMWHHQHHFRPINGATEMIDIVHYKIPFGFVGDIANALFVKRKLQEVFDFRRNKIDEIFGVYTGT